jgi:WD40 repeat protein/serine/threonine protein kinase
MIRDELQDHLSQPGTVPGVPVNWSVGDLILGLYEVKQVFTAGGMGIVYRVHHREWNTDLVVKSPRPRYFQTQSQIENFTREAETWVNLGLHPNIVSCYYVRTIDGTPRVFAEYVSGGSLSDWVRHGALYEGGPKKALHRILDISIQFAWGLHYAHEQGLVHQDVKPANLMISLQQAAKVTDFGLARARDGGGEPSEERQSLTSLVVPGAGAMTEAYCSPEQANGRPLSYRTDIWSWGVSVLEMFNGEPPCRYGGHMASEVFKSYLDGGAADSYLPEMPGELIAILTRCFEEEPAARPHSMFDIANDLQETYHHTFGKAYPRSQPKPAEALADSLNNRALSYLDLGRRDKAEGAWQVALSCDQQHPETVYNRGVILWRKAEVSDDVLVQQLESVAINARRHWQAKHYLGLVHLERGDLNSAAPLIRESLDQAPADQDLAATLGLIQSLEIPVGRCLRTFVGHTDRVTSVSLSKDGHLAISGSDDATLRLWETETGQCLRVFEGHEDYVQSVCLSNDAKFALSGSSDKTLRLWDLVTGECLRVFRGHISSVNSVCLSVDGRLAISGSGDNQCDLDLRDENLSVRLWDVKTGRCLRVFTGHTHIINSVHMSSDGELAVSGSNDWSMRLWEISTGRALGVREAHNFWVSAVRLSGDGRYVLSASGDVYNRDTTLRLWDGNTGECLRTFHGHTEWLNSVSLTNNARFALSGSEDRTLRLWEMATGRCLRTFKGHTGAVTSTALSDNGRFALSGSADRSVCLWELPIDPIKACSLRLSQAWSASELQEVEVKLNGLLENASQAVKTRSFSCALTYVRQARELPGCERKAAALDAWAALYPFCHRKGLRAAWPARILAEHKNGVTAVYATEDGRLLVSGGGRRGGSINFDFLENSIRVWDRSTGRCLQVLEGQINGLNSLQLSRDGAFALIATGERMFKQKEGGGFEPNGDGRMTLQLWDLSAGSCVRSFEGHRGWVSSACFSADGRFILSGGGDETIRLWEVCSSRCLRVFAGHAAPTGIDLSLQFLKFITGRVEAVCLSRDMRFALSGSGDMTLMLWDVSTGHCLRRMTGHHDVVTSVCLSPDNQFALSGSNDATLRRWDISTGRCLQVFEGHTKGVTSVCLSVDGQFALSGSEDSTVRLWDIDSGRCTWVFEGHREAVTSVHLSSNGRFALSGSLDNTVRLWELDWDLEAQEARDWDEKALPYLKAFVASHTPFLGSLPQVDYPSEDEIRLALTRRGRPTWNHEDWLDLLRTLNNAGYGWLDPDCIGSQLEKTAAGG